MMTTYFFTAFTQQRLHSSRLRARPYGQFRRPPPGLFAGWLDWLARRRTLRQQYDRLEELPDYLLEDIGLTRNDIARARREAFD